jgi:hypothetical protein
MEGIPSVGELMRFKLHATPVELPRYRPEIDGLRAIAILPVVFFHASTPGFSGGYVGVDVFFVISGYLIDNHLAAGQTGILEPTLAAALNVTAPPTSSPRLP